MTLLSLVIALLALLSILPDSRAAAATYADELIIEAKRSGLSEHPAWQALGHYRPNLLSAGRHSLIDSPSFFLAGDGKTNPESELEATLNAFFETPSADPESQHPQCAYIARYRWLKSKLSFDPDRLAEQRCARFEDWSKAINAISTTLIFPTAYLNNPASMFGHSLLRFDRPDQTEETRLLSYAVNYGAETDTDNGLLFAVLGLTGGYPGTYSVEPYYNLVKRYSDIEHRDIWEYQLAFSEEETARMLAHLWEMRGHYSEYYFFDENCSYQLLFLLDFARPGLNLADDFAVHVIPVDSVRSILRRKGLLRRAIFRPSGQTKIVRGLAELNAAERQLAQRLTTGDAAPDDPDMTTLPLPRQAALLELAEAFVTYQMELGDLERDVAAKRAWSLLAARSQIAESADTHTLIPPKTRPDQAHGSARFAVGAGIRDGRFFQSLRLRPAYHDRLDPSGGYVPGASIDFLDIELRHYQNGSKIAFEQLTGIGIRSMTPRNGLIQPISWKLKTGLERLRVDGTDEEGALVAVLEGGAGLSYSLSGQDITSLTLDLGVSAGKVCDLTCSFNAGPALSFIWPMTDRATLTADGRFQLRFGKQTDERYDIRLGQSYGFSSDFAIKVEAGIEDEGGGPQSEFLSSLNWYF